MHPSEYPAGRCGKGGKRPGYGSKRRINTDGYVTIYEPSHPMAMADGYVLEPSQGDVGWDRKHGGDPWPSCP